MKIDLFHIYSPKTDLFRLKAYHYNDYDADIFRILPEFIPGNDFGIVYHPHSERRETYDLNCRSRLENTHTHTHNVIEFYYITV